MPIWDKLIEAGGEAEVSREAAGIARNELQECMIMKPWPLNVMRAIWPEAWRKAYELQPQGVEEALCTAKKSVSWNLRHHALLYQSYMTADMHLSDESGPDAINEQSL